MSDAIQEGVAIIGLHGRFPGAGSVEEFWANLLAGRETVSFFTDAELMAAGLDPASLRQSGPYVPARGVIKDAECFDAAFFGIHPKEAEVMDPQHRVFLEACWEALERAGHAPGRIQGSVGVYAGAMYNTYYLSALHPRPELRELVGSEQVMLGNEKDYLATRVAYKLDLKGPAISLNTGCSSSLVAVCQAYQALMTFQCDVALAGGVSIRTPQQQGYFYQDGNIASPDGHTRTFDAAAQGTVFSNGVTLVVLKRLAEAVADGDEIFAVIKGAALNNDGGQRVSFGAPGVAGQSEAVALAQELAGFDPDSISYVEAHGTATPIGDPIEVAALTQAFRRSTQRKQFCALGSVKSNIGHLDAAAGTAGLIKTALALKHRVLPPSLHFQSPNPKLDLENSPFFVNSKLREWKPGKGGLLRAGVSSFGTGGTNAHVVIEEAPASVPSGPSRPWHLLLLSAKTSEALEAAARHLAAHLKAQPDANLADVAYTLQVGRSEFTHRRAVICQTVAEAVSLLEKPDPRKVFSARQELKEPPVVFLFPGQGAQYVNMGADLYRQERMFRETVDECARLLQPILDADLRQILFAVAGGEALASEQLRQTRFTQPALFTVEYALAKLWMSWGIQPSVMIGHSVGEYVAGCLSGVFPLETALMLVARRAELVQAQAVGAMLAVRLPEAEIRPLLNERLSIAAINAPNLCVASGPNDAIEELEKLLSAKGMAAKHLHTSHAFHSAMMDPVLAPFTELLRQARLNPPQIPYVSNVTAKWVTPEQATSPEYWAGHVRQTVRFADGVAELMKDPRYILLEVGPGQTLSQLARQHPAKKDAQLVLSTLSATREQELPAVIAALGRLWLAGAAIDWTAYYAGERRRRVVLPTYPFDRKRYYPETPISALASPIAASKLAELAPSLEPMSTEATAATAIPPAISRREHLVALVRSTTQELSGTTLEQVEAGASFLEIGLDSLLLTQAATLFQRKFGVPVSFRQLMEDLGSMEQLAAYLDEKLPPERFNPAAPPAVPTAVVRAASGASVPLGAGEILSGNIEQLLDQQLKVTAHLLALVRGQAGSQPALQPVSPPSSNSLGSAKVGKTSHGPFRPIERGSAGGLTGSQQQSLDAWIARYTKRTAGSKRLAAENRAGLADPRSNAGFKQLWKEMVYPIYTTRSDGSRVWDADGNEYLDFVMGFGASLFGHRPPFVIEAIQRQLDLGFEIGPIQPMVGETAALVCEMTGMERVAFCNTGSEAVLAAMRVARTVTGRDKIATFSGDYHGIFDEVLYRPTLVNGEPGGAPIAPGIPYSATGQLVVLEYGSDEALVWLRQHAGELAAVMVEPVQSRRLDLQPREFLHEVRRITEQANTALIFDEVVTGFRVHPGGAQAHFGVRADIATYGKVIGGGLPIGVVAGAGKYLDALDGGNWQFGDASFPEVGVTFFAGTFVRHPITIAVAKAVLEHLKREGPELQERVAGLAERAAMETRRVIEHYQAPLHLAQFSSLMYITIKPEWKLGGLLFYLLRDRGIHIFENRAFVFTTAHSKEDVERLVKAMDECLAELVLAGFIEGQAGNSALPQSMQSQTFTEAGEDSVVVDLSEAQREMWLGSLMDENLARAFNVSFVIMLRGSLDRLALEKACQTLIDRHDSLRAAFDLTTPVQRIARRIEVSLPFLDLSGKPPAEASAELERLIDEQTNRLMDITKAPLLRLHLVKTSDMEHALVLTVSHLIADGWSVGVLLHELNPIYSTLAGGTAEGLEPALQLKDYVRYCEGPAYQECARKAVDYWTKVFEAAPVPVDLPTDRVRPSTRTYDADRAHAIWNEEFVKRLRKAAGKQGATLQNFLLAAFAVLLNRLSRGEDLVVGIPAAGQISGWMREVPGSRALVGHCVNTLPLRLHCEGAASFNAFLKRVKQEMLAAYEHQDMTYGTLLQIVKLQRDPSRPPIVPILFNLDRAATGFRLGGLEGNVDEVTRKALVFDLSINIIDYGAELRIDCDYNTELFESTTMRRWLEHYRNILEAVIDSPDQSIQSVPLMDRAGLRQIVEEWNNTTAAYSTEKTLPGLIEEQSERTPEAIAVEFGSEKLTYRELVTRSRELAGKLRRLGAARDTLVGVFLERSVDMLVATLGVMRSGAAYVPLDPAFPQERLAFMIEDGNLPILITQQDLAKDLPPHQAKVVLMGAQSRTSGDLAFADTPIAPDSLAYVLFTSGSTGRPKGVQIEHNALLNFLRSMQREPGLASGDTLLAVTTLSFDIAGLELYLPLVCGGKVVIVPWELAMDGAQLGELIRNTKASVMQATPATWRLLLAAGWKGLPTLKILCGGEPLPPDLARELLPRCAELWNMYGPTETTIWSTCTRITRPEHIHIGRPIANTEIYILDPQLNPVPIGVPGELMIGGQGLARGYLNRPELTAEKFIAHPFKPGARLYRTGDLAKYLPDGNIVCLGRLDFQVKIRGYRIELGEIEATLARVPQVVQTVVAVQAASSGEPQLVAYLVHRDGEIPAADELRRRLRQDLPDYMVPSIFVSLVKLPLTPNGKVDRKALPLPSASHLTLAESRVAPRNETEAQLARLWEQVLGLETVGVTDDFFDLGGHSLLAVRLFTEIERRMHRKLPLASLFADGTIERLALRFAQNNRAAAEWPSLVSIQPQGRRTPLFCVHGAGGNVLLYRDLAASLGEDYPVYGFQSKGLDGTARPLSTVEEMADHYLAELKTMRPNGPYCLAGYCLGGMVAFQMARLLRLAGDEVAFVGLFDTYNPAEIGQASRAAMLWQRAKFHAGNLVKLRPRELKRYLVEKIRVARDGELSNLLHSETPSGASHDGTKRDGFSGIQQINDQAAENFRPLPFDGEVTLFKPRVNYSFLSDPKMGWGELVSGRLSVVELPVNPHAMLVEPFVKHLADALRNGLDRVEN